MSLASPEDIVIPDEILARVRDGMGKFFSKLNGVAPSVLAKDMLNPAKSIRSHEVLARYVDPSGKKILEVGSGYGINLIYWTKRLGLDVTSVEPQGEGFADTIEVSRQLCEFNNIPPKKIVVSQAETLPFPDASFDIVYSANVVEHTNDPIQVLRESLRVLRPGGILHFEMPNFTSYFEGHYFLVVPPLLHKALLPWWVKTLFGRDPAFARTLRTELNPMWLRRTIRSLGVNQPLRLVSLGEEVFRDRLKARSFDFQQNAVGAILAPIVELLRRLNVGSLAAKIFILLQAHYPIYLTVAKGRA